jgi:predicted ATP-grasp superfamily ATP-dependent carboligase
MESTDRTLSAVREIESEIKTLMEDKKETAENTAAKNSFVLRLR